MFESDRILKIGQRSGKLLSRVLFLCLVFLTHSVHEVGAQWRSQECELGASPLLPPSSPPILSPPLLTGIQGYNPRKLFEIKGARR